MPAGRSSSWLFARMKSFQAIPVGIITLGCPKNTADMEGVLSLLSKKYVLSSIEESEVLLFNTCAFLKRARDEVYEHLEKLKEKKVVLFGCLAGTLREDIFTTHPQVRAVVSGIHYPKMNSILDAVVIGKRMFAVSREPKEFLELKGKLLLTPPSYAYVKIAEGCDNACSYCLIPKLKGKYRSRKLESIVEEVKDLVALGIKEIDLVAQDCGFYGRDLSPKKTMLDLLRAVVSIPGDFWVRILYIYPERITDDLLQFIQENEKICRYLDIPLQHGDPAILKAMSRPHDILRIKKRITQIREIVPEITLRTSFIVGFPGEEERGFANLLRFIDDIRFDHVGIFEYSREPGTKSYGLPDQIDEETKKDRRMKAMLLQQKISLRANESCLGKTLKTLVESYDEKKKMYAGRPMRFAPEIDGTLFVRSSKPLPLNTFAPVTIEKAESYDLFGRAAGI